MPTTVADVIEKSLSHYADPYYDPVKAHEYYLKVRKLKGRQSTTGFDQKQREGLAYVRSRVAEVKKNKLDAARTTAIHGAEEARAAADAIRQDVAKKLQAFKDLVEKTNATADARTAQVVAKAQQVKEKLRATIAALPPIPKGLPPEARKALEEHHSAIVKVLTGQAQSNVDQLAKQESNTRLSERTSLETTRQTTVTDASARLQKAATDLKSALDKNMADYKAAKARIEAESKKALDTEFQKIKTKVR